MGVGTDAMAGDGFPGAVDGRAREAHPAKP